MSIDPDSLRILHYPHPALRRRAEPVAAVTPEVRAVAACMIDLMHEAEGIGLAAPQLGLPWRLFVTAARDDGSPDRVYVNPALSDPGRELVASEEGCLSLPGVRGEVRRPGRITVTATDLEGNQFTLTDDDLLARAWQHEMDHLDGVLIIDRMTPLDRLATRKAVRELELAAHHSGQARL
jgi:peptide deformylase